MKNADMNKESKNVWKVIKTEPENHDTTSLYLEGGNAKFSTRRAGQYASIRIMRADGWSEPHPFTISAAPEDQNLRLTIKKSGVFTTSIQDVQPGTPVKCAGPLGVFCKDIDTKDDIVMIAGGVGITPFLSVLRHFQNIDAKNSAILFWSNKTIEDSFAADELNVMTKELNLTVIHALTREENVQKYIQDAFPQVLYASERVGKELLQRYVDGIHKASIYLCGPPKMMDFVLEDLKNLDIDPKSVAMESFSWEKQAKGAR